MQVYTLTVSKNGSKLTPVEEPQESAPTGGTPVPRGPGGAIPAGFVPPPGATFAGPGTILASAITMNQIVIVLGRLLDRPLIDKTRLTGYFNVRLQFDSESSPRAALASASPAPPVTGEPAGPSLFTAIQEQLGLKLDLRKAPVEVLVIDSVLKPTEN
jgi:uncharacterized protein (TIGR03435 family)